MLNQNTFLKAMDLRMLQTIAIIPAMEVIRANTLVTSLTIFQNVQTTPEVLYWSKM